MDALLSDSFRADGPSTVETRPVHIFFHLPRCAGQTIHRHLSSHAPAGTYFRVRKRKGASRIFVPKYSVSDMPDPGELNAISGHWVGDSIVRKFPDRPIARSILLRDPVSQFISHYNFRMMRYLSVGLRPYPIEVAYRARRRNFLTHFILRTFAETPWWRAEVAICRREIRRSETSFFPVSFSWATTRGAMSSSPRWPRTLGFPQMQSRQTPVSNGFGTWTGSPLT